MIRPTTTQGNDQGTKGVSTSTNSDNDNRRKNAVFIMEEDAENETTCPVCLEQIGTSYAPLAICYEMIGATRRCL